MGTALAAVACAGVHAQQATPTVGGTAAVENPPAGGAPAAPDADQNHFDMLEIRVLGNTVLPAPDIERAVYPFLGPGKTLKDVEAARTELENVYHQRGYGTVFVDIPEQNVEDGVVRLHATEATLRTTRVTGARYFSGRAIRSALPAAAENTAPHLPSLQTQITSVNSQSNDRLVVPVLKAGPVPGTVDLTLQVQDHLPFHGSFEINNQRTADTSPLRGTLALSYDNLFDRFDSLSLQYQRASTSNEVDVLAAGYSALLNDTGTRLSFLFIHSNSDVSTIGDVGVLGKGDIYGVKLLKPLLVRSDQSHSLSLGFDYKDYKENIRLNQLDRLTSTPSADIQTPISYTTLSLGYTGAWMAEKRRWTLAGAANLGLRGLGNSADEFENKRFRARPNFFYLTSDASFATAFLGNTTLLVRLGGQYAIESIIGNDQFSLGGVNSVRGYLEAEELADTGIKGSLELGSPPWKLGENLHLDAFTFYDAGRISFINPLPGESTSTSLRSAGLGINIGLFDHFTGVLTWAYPLVDGTRTSKGDARWLFGARSTW